MKPYRRKTRFRYEESSKCFIDNGYVFELIYAKMIVGSGVSYDDMYDELESILYSIVGKLRVFRRWSFNLNECLKPL